MSRPLPDATPRGAARRPSRATTLAGRGLHGGRPARVTFEPREGPSMLVAEGVSCPIGRLALVRTDAGVCVRLGPRGPVVDLVEHFAAALGALGLHHGVRATVEGGELPLLDGGAADLARALGRFGVRPVPAPLVVARPFEFALGSSRYSLRPGDDARVEVDVTFDHPLLGRMSALWGGSPDEFLARIAPARTFGFARDEPRLRASGRAAGVDLAAVVVFTADGLLEGCRLASPDEPARHKLLDVIGDLALYGGPPRGHVVCAYPGHTATHAMTLAALAAGALVRPPVVLIPAPRPNPTTMRRGPPITLPAASANRPGRCLLLARVRTPSPALACAALIALAAPTASAQPDLRSWFDPRNPDALPEGFAPPTLPDLTHRAGVLNVENDLASVAPHVDAGAPSPPRAVVWLTRVEYEHALFGRLWYAGAAYEAAYSRALDSSSWRYLSGYPEFWTRAVWASQAGLAYGGGVSVIVPVFRREADSPGAHVADTVRVIRPWDYAPFADNTITARPYVDARVIDGRVTLQLRQGFEFEGLVAEARVPKANVVSQTTFFLGYQPLDELGLGLELWEVYFVSAPSVSDASRAVFAITPSVRWLGGSFQPALSATLPFENTLFNEARSYWAARLSLSWIVGDK